MQRTPSVASLSAVALIACGPSGPPARTSPTLATSATPIAADAIFLDVRDGDPLWAQQTSSGDVVYVDRTGTVAGAIPMHANDIPRGLRGLASAEIWACFDDGIAHFASGAWTFTDWSALGTAGAPVSCDALDARAGNDVWVTGSGSLCHHDGATWSCRGDLPGQAMALALTTSHAWLSYPTGMGATTALLVADTSSMTSAIASLDVGDLVAIGTITPVPGAEEVYLTHDPAALNVGDVSARRFSTTALVRVEGGSQAVPVSADETYVLEYLDSTSMHCSGGFTGSCGVDTLWSQLVVHHVVGTTSTEVAHYTDPSGPAVPSEAMLVDGRLTFPGPITYVLP